MSFCSQSSIFITGILYIKATCTHCKRFLQRKGTQRGGGAAVNLQQANYLEVMYILNTMIFMDNEYHSIPEQVLLATIAEKVESIIAEI